ncbi:MAG TPA: S41 family peptidase [Bryobacteraceae bacterium]|nr:S41 family peptidase [Bryobacteraceae bacterium]
MKCSIFIFLMSAAVCPAQMTPLEKATDFTQLAATYAMNYGPIQWKRDTLGVDLLNIGDWLTKAMNTRDDLDFYEVCVSYVASLNDAHDSFTLPVDPVSGFQAYLGFTVDVYDGKTIIEFIDRKLLSTRDFPFQIGDELVSIDGVATPDLLQSFIKYSIAANPLSTRRIAADSLTFRDQAFMPHAHVIPDVSTVVINQQNGGFQSFSVPWLKTGIPITIVGPVIPPFSSSTAQDTAPATSDYEQPLKRLRNMRVRDQKFILGFGEIKPVFALPSNFVVRMGTGLFDSFYTGTYQAQGVRIGYIRIPSFDPFLSSDDFQTEINYMQQNTDGLIVDIMRNPGGDGCTAEDLLSRLIPFQFRTVGLEIRATRRWVVAFQQALQDAQDSGASAIIVRQLQNLLDQVTAAFLTPSGRTAALPVCSTSLDVVSAMDSGGNVIAYSKPMMLLVDELSASAADLFAAVIQDNQRGPLFGMRTMGAGGNVNPYSVTTYSEGAATITESLMHRKNPIVTNDFPTAPYVENIGVRPEIVQDYMTLDNLLNKGATFVQAFTDAMVKVINSAPASGTDPVGQRRQLQ